MYRNQLYLNVGVSVVVDAHEAVPGARGHPLHQRSLAC